MATPIKMPDIGTTVETVKVVRWLKRVGDPVKRGEPLCEVETDKATSELESYAEGVLLWQAVPEMTEVDAGSIIAYVGLPGEEIPGLAKPGAPPATPAAAKAAPEPAAVAAGPAKVSVLIRNLAKREGVDLEKVVGTAPGGTVTREDVLRAKSSPATPAVPAPASAAAPARGKLSPNQRVVARRVAKSWAEIVPIHFTARISMKAAMALREKTRAETGKPLSYDAILVRTVAGLLKDFPRFAAHLEGEEIVPAAGIHIGLAVSAGDDLYTPVVKDADKLTLAEIHQRIEKLAEKARVRTLSLEEMAGACLTISNLGMYPIESFTVIIPPGQSAALSVGAAQEVAVIRDGVVRAEPQAGVVLAVDHRLINGRQAAEFLAALKKAVEAL